MKRFLRSVIDRLVRGSMAPVADRLAAVEREALATRGEIVARSEELARATGARADAAARRAEELAAAVARVGEAARERSERDRATAAHEAAVLRRDLDALAQRINRWSVGERLAQLSAVQRGQDEHAAAIARLSSRVDEQRARLDGHDLGARMAQLSKLQADVVVIAEGLSAARAAVEALRARIDGHDLGARMAQLSALQRDAVNLAAGWRATDARLEELRQRIDAHRLGDRMAQLSRLEQRQGEAREAAQLAAAEHQRLARRLDEAERVLRELIDRTQRWGLGERVQQVSRMEGELRAHAEVQRRLDSLLLAVAERAAPDIAWLARNREERMDAHSPLFRADRRAFHLARYRFAARRVRGLVTGDIACGTGYGSALLADAGAARVVGIDADAGAVAYARERYARPVVEYVVADARRTPLGDASLDALVSFETIEHVDDPERLVAEFARVLKPGGLLILSTPNDWGLEHAPFHRVSLDLAALRGLLEERFEVERAWGQEAPAVAIAEIHGRGDEMGELAGEVGDLPAGFVELDGESAQATGGAECLVVVARARSAVTTPPAR